MATKTHTFSDSKILLNVTEPTNVTGNDAHIARYFWKDGATPSDSMSAGGTGNSDKYSWYGKFISCMELDWGNAKGQEDEFTNMTETKINNLLFTKGIKTSDELLQVLCWLFKNRSQSSDPFATISSTTITRPKNNTLSGISWVGGSISSNNVISGDEITFNKGTVIATYGNNNGTTTITTSNISGVLTITSSDTSVVTINTVVKNGQTTITGITNGTAIITVKDDEKVVNEFEVTVENELNTIDVTDSTIFNDSKGSSIDGTTITAPTVTSEETITITATYGGQTASTEISYTVTPATIVSYYWYVGQTDPSTMTEISPIVSDNSSPGWREIGTTLPNYNSSNMLWNGDNNNITFENRDYYYVAVPNNNIKIWNGLGGSEMDSFSTPTTKILNGITYYIYKSNSKGRSFVLNLYN